MNLLRRTARAIPTSLIDATLGSPGLARLAGHVGLRRRLGGERLTRRLDHPLRVALTCGLQVHCNPEREGIIAREFVRDGVYEQGLLDLIAVLLPADGRMLDVGGCYGHVGMHAGLCAPAGEVVIVEANPAMAARIKAHIDTNGLTNVQVINAAAGSGPGTVALEFDAENLGATQVVAVDGGDRAAAAAGARVAVIALDDLVHQLAWPRVDLVKLDVEGYELEALRGLASVLTGKHRPTVICEHSTDRPVVGGDLDDLWTVMDQAGYRAFLPERGKAGGGQLRPIDRASAPHHDNVVFQPVSG